MRTAADLQGAFALIESQADDYYRRTVEAPVEEQPVVHELVVEGGRARRRSRLVTSLSIAAVAAAVAAAFAWIGVAGEHQVAPTGGVPAAVPLTYDVTIAPALGLAAFSVHTEAAFTQVAFTGRSPAGVMVRVFPAERGPTTRGLEPLTVNGHRGYYGAGDPFARALTRPPAAVFPALPAGIRAVIWEYTPHRWAEVVFETGSPTRAELLRVARAVAITRPRPIRTVLKLTARPDHLRLAAVDSRVDGPRSSGTGLTTLASVTYRSEDARRTVSLYLLPIRAGKQDGPSVSINGKPGYWTHYRVVAGTTPLELAVETGRAELRVAGGRGQWTRAEIVAVARTVVINPHPDDPSRWYVARTALP